VTFDLARSGVLAAPPASAPGLTEVPTYRSIPYQVLNGVPDEVRSALGLPTGELTSDVPIPNDGAATILTLAGQLEKTESDVVVEFDHPFGQFIPKPFCSTGPLDWLRISGSVHMVHRVRTDEYGRYVSAFRAAGTLQVVPINPQTQQATGEPYEASVTEAYLSMLTNHTQAAAMTATQVLESDPTQSLVEKLWAGYWKHSVSQESCGF
jgi:hypothetical protein